MGSVCPPKLPLTPLGGRMSDLPSLSAVDVGNSTPPSAKPPAPTPTPRRSPQVDYRSALPACGHHPHPRGPSRPGSHQINHAKPRRRPRRRPLFFPTTGIPGACADSPTPHRSPSSVPQSPSASLSRSLSIRRDHRARTRAGEQNSTSTTIRPRTLQRAAAQLVERVPVLCTMVGIDGAQALNHDSTARGWTWPTAHAMTATLRPRTRWPAGHARACDARRLNPSRRTS